jgi:hypothetical protein
MTKPSWPLSVALALGCQPPSPGHAVVVQDVHPSDLPPSSTLRVELQARKVVDLPGVGDVSDLDLLQGTGSPRLLVAGTCGSAVVDLAEASVEATRPFALPCPPFLSSRIVDVDGDGRDDFARFETGWVGPTAVLDSGGAVQWQHEFPAACASVLDLDGDHRKEILVREANSDFVELIDHKGEVRWRRHLPEGEIVAFDTDADGKQELLAIDGKQLVIYGGDGNPRGTTRLPGGGFINTIHIETLGTESGAPEVIVGTYVAHGADEGQWYHRYARDAQTHLGRQPTGTEIRHELMAEIPPGKDHGRLFLTLFNHLEQAPIAGFKASELALYVVGESGEVLGECRFSKAEQKVATADGDLLVLAASPARILVGYGDGLWEVTLEGDAHPR